MADEVVEITRKPCPDCGKDVTWTTKGVPRKHKCEATQPEKEETAEQSANTGGVTADRVIAAYISTRDEIDAKKKALDADLAELKELQEKRAKWLMGQMDKLGTTQFKAAGVGSCFIEYKTSAKVSDRESFYNWVREDWEARKHYLENRVNKTAVKDALENEEGLPHGVDYTKIKDIKVRRS